MPDRTPAATPMGIDDAAVVAFEELAARSWPAPDSQRRGPWLLRAAQGWTGRANSALPLAWTADLGAWLPEIIGWYTARGLPPRVVVPSPTFDDLWALLHGQRWRPGHGAEFMTAPIGAVMAAVPSRDGLPQLELADAPDAEWLAAYHHGGKALPPVAIGILQGGGGRFARLRLDGRTAAICRLTIEPPWAGITAMEVAAPQRRRGLARHLLRNVLAVARDQGADRAWLQVDPRNQTARRLYETAGFVVHHAYRYFTAPATTAAGEHSRSDRLRT